MKIHNASLLGLILAVVFLSGCIGGGTDTGGTKGVIITSFEPDISEIYSGDEIVFTAMVENIGEEDADDIELRIFGLGNDWDIDDKTQKINFLEKQDADEGIPGGTGEVQWTAESPSNLKVDNVYTATIRMTYSYETTALANIRAYNSDYLKTIPEEAGDIMNSNGLDSFTVTDAPITVELSGISKPIVSSGDVQSSITVLISNIGDGKPFDSEETDMTVTVDRIKVGDNSPCVSNEKYRIPRNGKKSVACTFDLDEIDSYTTIPMEIEISYNYFIDDSAKVTVLKALFVEEDGNGDYDDDTKPTISSVDVDEDDNSATITWTTNERSDSVVYYGTSCTSSSLEEESKSSRVRSHQITLTGLDVSTKYYYKIESTDSSGNTGKYPSSGCRSFTTLAAGSPGDSDVECYVHADCCSNVVKSDSSLTNIGPCDADDGAYCDDNHQCHCGSTYTSYETCPPINLD